MQIQKSRTIRTCRRAATWPPDIRSDFGAFGRGLHVDSTPGGICRIPSAGTAIAVSNNAINKTDPDGRDKYQAAGLAVAGVTVGVAVGAPAIGSGLSAAGNLVAGFWAYNKFSILLANLMRLPGHVGSHSRAYHQFVLDKLTQATRGLSGDAAKKALTAALQDLRTMLEKDPTMVRMQ